jgi:anti-anti-sigma factor
VSSAGLRVFLAVLKFLEKNDGRIVLCGMKPFVDDVFNISGFSELFDIVAGREEALALYA